MKSFTVLRAAAFRGLKPQLLDGVNPLELIEAIRVRYSFMKAPDPEKVAQQPMDFQVGKLVLGTRTIRIDQLLAMQIATLTTTVAAATRSSTDDAEAFLGHLSAWVAEDFKLDVESLFPPAYHSQVEFEFEKPLSTHFEQVRSLAQAITNLIRGYGLKNCPDFEFGGFSMHFDTNQPSLVQPMPTPFSIERRVGAPYATNKYFSQAPLRTQDHKAVLEQLERILLS